jgi:antitoxin (DNA-binding transcriptional repressor) of toxin-antitoxin stability system
MKTAGVRELKARLSSYLREVQRGEVVLVTDRGRVVAEVRRPGAAERPASTPEPRYRGLGERGVVRPAARPQDRSWAKGPSLGVTADAIRELLDAERGE